MREKFVEEAVRYLRDLFPENSDGHDAAHALRVYRTAMTIADTEPGCDKRVVALAALLHDADDDKLTDTEHQANARAFLRAQKVPEEETERICAVIDGVSFRKNRDRRPETVEGRIVQDADRLDALGAVGIARTFAYGGRHGRSPEASVGHFYEKLLLLKSMMQTTKGRALAEERHAFLERFLEEWEKEQD